jgi:voltage-gated potassium channel Kch
VRGGSTLFILGALVAVLGTKGFGSDSARLVGLPIVILTPPAIATGIVRHTREERGITLQTMFGVLCLYLLIGLAYASALETIQEVFNDPPLAPLDPRYYKDGVRHAEFLYFSFATLTTVGYGDLVAITNLGRSLAITEALFGQIYLVTVVALIVANIRAPQRRRVPEKRATWRA